METVKLSLVEIEGDLFGAPSDTSLGHCVAADLKMGKGIAIKFRDQFKQLDKLQSQNVPAGGVAVLQDNDRFIYYLITKQFTYQKPTYADLNQSLIAMRDHMKNHNVTKLALPRIGCGLDGLVWSKVKDQLMEVFQNESVSITIYNFSAQK